jgi:hypothetical protein
MITADDLSCRTAQAAQQRELNFRINLEAVWFDGEVSGGVERGRLCV